MTDYVCPFCNCPLITFLDTSKRMRYLELKKHLKTYHRITPLGVHLIEEKIIP